MITNLIVFPPTLLLVQLFRRTKRRNTRIRKIKNLLKEKNFGNKEIKEDDDLEHKRFTSTGLKKTLTESKLPWWFKIIAYVLAFAFAGVSLFFIIVQGITFGNDKVEKWLTSLVISFLTSMLLTQPLQVIFFRIFIHTPFS